MYLKQAIAFQIYQKNFEFFDRSPPFLLSKNNLKIKIFRVFFTSKRIFGGYFEGNVCTPFYKICTRTMHDDFKSIRELIGLSIYQRTSFWSHSSVFVLKKQPGNLKFKIFFTSKIPI